MSLTVSQNRRRLCPDIGDASSEEEEETEEEETAIESTGNFNVNTYLIVFTRSGRRATRIQI